MLIVLTEHIRNASTDKKPEDVEAIELEPSKLPHKMVPPPSAEDEDKS